MTRIAGRCLGFLAVLALVAGSGVALGQAQTGNIFVKVVDEGGVGLPGASVQVSGIGAPLNFVTNAQGEARFVSLSPGSYTLVASLSGFTKVTRPSVTVAVGQNTAITIPMKLSGIQESVVVTGESPLLDVRKTGSQTVVSQVELNSVPTARDPWVVLQTTPGVQIDRVNVGGSESGQQSNFIGKGSGFTQATWNIDGVNTTDMAATGGSAIYYDFDSVAEFNMALGGTDASIQTPGVQLNLVTKRGTNDVHGSARVFYETRKWSGENRPDEYATQPTPARSGNEIDQLQDYGAEIGGPAVKDYLWLWGSYGRQQIDLLTADGLSDKTSLLDYTLKLNAQPIAANSFNAVMTYADKLKYGRGAAWNRPPEAAWDQTGPTKIYKVEDSHVFSANVFATASYSRVVGGFDLISPGKTQMFQDGQGVYHNSYYSQSIKRPQTQINVTPSVFARTGNIGHEIKVGFTYRDTPSSTQAWWPSGILGVAAEWWGTDYNVAGFTRDNTAQVERTYYSAFLSDTLTIDKLTVQAGVRYDYQKGQQPANEVYCCQWSATTWPQVPLKSVSVPAVDPVVWEDFSPRLGATYALGNDGKTLLKASYARFVSQLGGNTINVGYAAPGGASGIAYLYYEWNDKNGNEKVEPGEVNFDNLDFWRNFDPSNPNSLTTSPNQIDPGIKAPKTDEVILSGERELMPAFVVGLAGTYRHMSDFTYAPRLAVGGARVMTPADYTCAVQGPYPVPNGSPQYVNVCNPSKSGVFGSGGRLMNRPGYYQTYLGVDLTATKRYADKWMARFSFTWSDWTQHGLAEGQWDPANRWGGTEDEGGILAPSTTTSGPKADVYVNSTWQTTLSGMYTLPLDFNVSTSVFARQGYPVAYYVNLPSVNTPGGGSSKNYQLGRVDDVRLGTVVNWDLGLAKVVKVGPMSVQLQLDVFNVLNANTILQRTTRVRSTMTTPNASDSDAVENQSPRIFRVGTRLSF